MNTKGSKCDSQDREREADEATWSPIAACLWEEKWEKRYTPRKIWNHEGERMRKKERKIDR
jgi:hypothetical protein